MMNIFRKIKFIFNQPKVVIVAGKARSSTKEAVFQVLNSYFKIGREILVWDADLKNQKDFERAQFLIKNSSLPVLIITHYGDIPFDRDFFAGERKDAAGAKKLAKTMPPYGYLILNFDDETTREIQDETNLRELTFGFQEKANFKVTDIHLNRGTNFKINYKGSFVPVWLERIFGKEQVYSALAAAAAGVALGLNLVEVSQALRNYKSLPGKMRMIEGIKHSWILDDSESATLFSMIEAIEILGKIKSFKRKIAVLGDVIGIGKYAIGAHEAIGERIVGNAHLLFTFGPRAKFIARGAIQKGMPVEKIFQFDTIDEGRLRLQSEIKEGDLILVDGSREMKMKDIIEEIQFKFPSH